MKGGPLVSAFILLGFASRVGAADIDITACGQAVAAGSVGHLQADLVCDTGVAGSGGAYPDYISNRPSALHLDNRATLDMQGHSITITGQLQIAISCDSSRPSSRCTVMSSGTAGKIISDWPSNNPRYGVSGYNVDVDNLEITGVGIGIGGPETEAQGGRRLRATNLNAHDNRWGVAYWRVAHVSHSDLSANALVGAMVTGRLFISDSTLADNGFYGIQSLKTVKATNCTVTGNERVGIFANKRIDLSNVTVSLNATAAAVSDGVIKITGCSFDEGDPAYAAGYVDFASKHRPMLETSSCRRSAHYEANQTPQIGGSWSVCSDD